MLKNELVNPLKSIADKKFSSLTWTQNLKERLVRNLSNLEMVLYSSGMYGVTLGQPTIFPSVTFLILALLTNEIPINYPFG